MWQLFFNELNYLHEEDLKILKKFKMKAILYAIIVVFLFVGIASAAPRPWE